MSGVRLEGDWKKLEENLHRLARVNWTRLHKEIGEHLVSSTQERFKTETAPDGTKWPQSIRAREEGGQTLSDTRRLRNSISYAARPDRVEVGTNDKRAPVHQFGATIRPSRAKALKFQVGGRWAVKKLVRIPARPFLGLSDDDQVAISEIIRERLEECLK
ncbi:phage virion morphogenesis protein [Desulfofundulus sp. TPOSR]|uniref:phage virion morphogenesis protein n=1 Tax=Desulfofundulus sp. TPOSR TaxID=2714340 RepID=UPI00140B29AD|nr:phage virion morphogenesis protein [Desulfofundulus sp. TPOSR]NHM25458.1 phage virion morphogenesis protein [Desulfofundulus sp. TPOSR]NHM27046.1 phage virion morphogenesis protein [Desulfofundulus sp. TPOSR]